MGGGFGACTINIIKSSRVPEFVEEISRSYRQQFDLDLSAYEVSIEDGAQIIY